MLLCLFFFEYHSNKKLPTIYKLEKRTNFQILYYIFLFGKHQQAALSRGVCEVFHCVVLHGDQGRMKVRYDYEELRGFGCISPQYNVTQWAVFELGPHCSNPKDRIRKKCSLNLMLLSCQCQQLQNKPDHVGAHFEALSKGALTVVSDLGCSSFRIQASFLIEGWWGY